ncbi:MAG TPA: hypothetical protein VF669_07460 [Tepidisphaeraceae bacterium]|jgi:hypothetical protein
MWLRVYGNGGDRDMTWNIVGTSSPTIDTIYGAGISGVETIEDNSIVYYRLLYRDGKLFVLQKFAYSF